MLKVAKLSQNRTNCRLQDRERRTVEKRLKTLEAALDALEPLAEKETERLTVAKLKTYAETAAIFQRMLYKSYGIEDTRKLAMMTAFSPQSVRGSITRYRIDRVEPRGSNTPPQGKHATPHRPTPNPHRHHTYRKSRTF